MLEKLCTQVSTLLLLKRNYNHEESSLPTEYRVFSSPIQNEGSFESPHSTSETKKTYKQGNISNKTTEIG